MNELMTYEARIKKITMRSKHSILRLKITFVTKCDEKGKQGEKEFIWYYNDAYLKYQVEKKFLMRFTKSEKLEDLIDGRVRIITESDQLRAIGDRVEDKFVLISYEDFQENTMTEAETKEKLRNMSK